MRVMKSRTMTWAEHVGRMEEIRNMYKILVGKPEENNPLGRTRYRLESNIKMDLKEITWEYVNWIYLAQIGTSDGLL
jgi:hypothetical protein